MEQQKRETGILHHSRVCSECSASLLWAVPSNRSRHRLTFKPCVGIPGCWVCVYGCIVFYCNGEALDQLFLGCHRRERCVWVNRIRSTGQDFELLGSRMAAIRYLTSVACLARSHGTKCRRWCRSSWSRAQALFDRSTPKASRHLTRLSRCRPMWELALA